MATAYTEFTSQTGTGAGGVAADVKNAILASSDWAHLLISGAVNTTLSASGSVGDGTVSVAASIAAGQVITVDPGGANQECLAVASVSGAGPYTLTLQGNNGQGLRHAHASGVTVQAGAVVKATTTRGAQMVLDLADGAVATYRLQIGVYRTHDGTTGVDKKVVYLNWNATAYANASDPVHCIVSSGKEHVYLWTHGPYLGESVGTTQSDCVGQSLILGDIVPYFSGDTTAAVALSASDAVSQVGGSNIGWVSRDAANANSWVTADFLTLGRPAFVSATAQVETSPQNLAAGDSNYYLWPFVVVERVAGLRGRISKCFMVGWYSGTPGSLNGFGDAYTYSGDTYVSAPVAGSLTVSIGVTVSLAAGYGSTMPVIAVPKS